MSQTSKPRKRPTDEPTFEEWKAAEDIALARYWADLFEKIDRITGRLRADREGKFGYLFKERD